jgi:hypothetical protein
VIALRVSGEIWEGKRQKPGSEEENPATLSRTGPGRRSMKSRNKRTSAGGLGWVSGISSRGSGARDNLSR